MYFNDTLNLEGAGVGILLISPKGEQLNTSYKSSTRPPTTAQSMKP
jgi:hypothetical protein